MPPNEVVEFKDEILAALVPRWHSRAQTEAGATRSTHPAGPERTESKEKWDPGCEYGDGRL